MDAPMRQFAEVREYPRPERPFASCVPGQSYRASGKYDITEPLSEVGTVPVRSSSPLWAASWPLASNRTAATESGEQELAKPISHEQAPDALALHLRSLARGEHGIRDEAVIGEHRVVASHVCFGKPHTLMVRP